MKIESKKKVKKSKSKAHAKKMEEAALEIQKSEQTPEKISEIIDQQSLKAEQLTKEDVASL